MEWSSRRRRGRRSEPRGRGHRWGLGGNNAVWGGGVGGWQGIGPRVCRRAVPTKSGGWKPLLVVQIRMDARFRVLQMRGLGWTPAQLLDPFEGAVVRNVEAGSVKEPLRLLGRKAEGFQLPAGWALGPSLGWAGGIQSALLAP